MKTDILFTDDSIVFGILIIALGLVFYTESLKKVFGKNFIKLFLVFLWRI